jgi:DNA-binding winged helix-turn-helix (wHTH) protein/hemoglobin-like flavoprotein
MGAPVHVRFGDVVVDERRREVSRGGVVVPIQSKVLDVLLYLVRHRDRVVTRDEIFDAVWSDAVVGPSSLSRAIREVRKALGDDDQQMVRTFAGHGFRFVASAVDVPSDVPRAVEAVTQAGSSLPPSSRPALHGRARELASLARALRRARGGRLVVRVVSGEPGIGKTHLLQGFSALAAASGARVLHGRVRYGDAGAPLAAWRDVAEHLGISLDAMPEETSRDAIRWARARAALAGVRAASREGALVILIDDADRADASSWRLLEDLLDDPHETPALVVVSVRASARRAPDVVRASGRALREDPEAVLELSPLESDAVAQLAAELLGWAPSEAAVQKLVRLSGGHPLLARHLVHAAMRSFTALETLDVSSAARSSGLRTLVLSHLGDVEESHRRILDAAAIVGVPFTAELLAEVSGMPPTEVKDGLQASVEGGLLQHDAAGCFEFAHEIVREVVADVLQPSARARLHRRVARAIDQPHSERADHLERVVFHYIEGAADGDADRALEVACIAARSAARAAAFDVASRHFAAAVAVEALLPPDPARRAGLHLELGTTLAKDGRIEDATRAFTAAAPPRAPAGTAALQAAFFAIAPDLPRAVERFYALLFERHPGAKRLFVRNDPKVQRRMFGATLSALVEHAADEAWLDEHLAALAERHHEYGVTDEMYDWVRDALLDALDEAAGRAGLPEGVHASWGALYDGVARKMRVASATPRVSSGASQE